MCNKKIRPFHSLFICIGINPFAQRSNNRGQRRNREMAFLPPNQTNNVEWNENSDLRCHKLFVYNLQFSFGDSFSATLPLSQVTIDIVRLVRDSFCLFTATAIDNGLAIKSPKLWCIRYLDIFIFFVDMTVSAARCLECKQ